VDGLSSTLKAYMSKGRAGTMNEVYSLFYSYNKYVPSNSNSQNVMKTEASRTRGHDPIDQERKKKSLLLSSTPCNTQPFNTQWASIISWQRLLLGSNLEQIR